MEIKIIIDGVEFNSQPKLDHNAVVLETGFVFVVYRSVCGCGYNVDLLGLWKTRELAEDYIARLGGELYPTKESVELWIEEFAVKS